MSAELLRILEECRAAGGGECALATVVATKGSTYRRAGARVIVRNDRRMWGAISGGCLEADIAAHALDVIRRGESKLIHYRPSDDDFIVGLGTGCQGELAIRIEPLPLSLYERLSIATRDEVLITVDRTWVGSRSDAPADAFVQAIVPRLSLFLFGASPAAEPLLRFAKQLGWCVRLADHRPFIATDERYTSADAIEIAPAEELPSRFDYPSPAAAVVMTHHYLRDLELLRQLAPLQLAYLGIVGARDRARRLITSSIALGTVLPTTLHAPAGLDLGADTPSEIALAIIAEIQAALRGTNATPLCHREGRIHGEEKQREGGVSELVGQAGFEPATT